MIDFRYHIVSLIAVFLALALGLFLGSTTLQSTVTHNLQRQADAVTSRNNALNATNKQLTGQLNDERSFLAAIERDTVAGRLAADDVAVISAPGVSSQDRQGVESTLRDAGATVAADVQLQSAYLDPTQDAELGSLAQQLRLPRQTLASGNGSTRISGELAAALTARPGRPGVPRVHVEAVLNTLSDGQFVTVTTAPTHQAAYAVLLVPPPSSGTSIATARSQNAILLALAAALQRTTTHLVIAGRTQLPPVGGGALDAAASDPSLTGSTATVDLRSPQQDSDAVAGRIAVVLALAGSGPGSYGLGRTPPVPTTSATP